MARCTHATGVIVEAGGNQGVPGVLVRIRNTSSRSPETVGETTTDAEGRFAIDLRTGASDAPNELELSVFEDGAALPTTGQTRWPADSEARDIVVCVERNCPCGVEEVRPPNCMKDCLDRIHGIVRHDDGTPLPGLEVALFAVGFQGVKQVGKTVTSVDEGWFCIGGGQAREPVDLLVKVFIPAKHKRKAELVGRSEVAYHYNGGALRFKVNICDDRFRGPSEFTRLVRDLGHAIYGDGGPHPLDEALRTLSENQVRWLSGHTGWDPQRVRMCARAAWLSHNMSPPSQTVSIQGLYGLLRHQFPKTSGEILARPPSAVRAVIQLARRGNIIGLNFDAAAFMKSLIGALATTLNDGGDGDLGTILGTSRMLGQPQGLSVENATKICKIAALHNGDDSALWEAVTQIDTMAPADVDEAKRLVRLGTIGLGHAPTVTSTLRVKLGTLPANTVGTWDSTTWHAVAADVQPLPGGLDGSDEAQKRSALAALLQQHAALAFPAQALNRDLLGPVGAVLGVDAILSRPANVDIDLRTARIYESNPTIEFQGDVVAEVTALRTAQRLVRIAPDQDTGAALQRLSDSGVSAARDVVQIGRTRFLATYANGDPTLELEALEIVAKARSQAAMASAFYLQAHPALGQASLGFVANESIVVTEAEVPGWDDLFVTPAGTRCAWCQSIHGPTAYLVDMMHWLSKRTKPAGTGTDSALDALLDRRPDLAELPLSCENAERVLPYIDLTLEVLEAVASGAGISTANSSEVDTPEMLASPQYTQDAAYDSGTAGDEISAFATPFHRPVVEARAFLAHLGIHRADLMRAFQAGGSPSDATIAYEELELSIEGAAAILDTATDEDNYWSHTIGIETSVKTWRRSTGRTYTHLLDLLHTRAANPTQGDGELVVVMDANGDPYDVSTYKLKQIDASSWIDPTPDQYTAMRQVLRLWAATGWTLLETDKVTQALGASTPSAWDDATLTAVGDVHRLARLTKLVPDELASWFGDLDTFEDRDATSNPVSPLYDRTFLSPSLFPASEREAGDGAGTQLFAFALNAARTEIEAEADLRVLLDHSAKLAAVLARDVTEVSDLIAALDVLENLDRVVHPVDSTDVPGVTLTNLSRLYRWSSAARVLGLLPTEALRISQWLGVPPAAGDEGPFSSPAAAIAYLDHVGALFTPLWTVDQVDYLLNHGATDRAAPTEDFLREIIGGLRDTARAQADDEDAAVVDTLTRSLADALGLERTLLDDLNARMKLGAPCTDPTHSGHYPLFLVAESSFAGTSVSVTLDVDAAVDDSADTVVANTEVLIGAAIAGAPVRSENDDLYIWQKLAQGDTLQIPAGTTLTLADGSEVILDAVTTATIVADIDTEVGPFPATSLLSVGLITRFLRTEFVAESETDETDPWSDLTATDFPEDHSVLQALHKAALLIGTLDADLDEVQAFVAQAEPWSLLDPAELVGAALNPLSDPTPRLRNLVALFAQRARLPGSSPTFAALIADPTPANIVARTAWDLDTWTALDNWTPPPTGTPPPPPAFVEALEHALDKMEIVRLAGADLTVVESWAAPGDLSGFTPEMGRQVVAAARSRYADPNRWGSVARPVRDSVRRAQRDALVSYLISQEPGEEIENAEDLYQRYLIDVSMNPEMLTSRIVQASATVQLFIHRILFGLEVNNAGDNLGDWLNNEDAAQWEWMRTYRVWEAARKVFLYPENWIEPELRMDKTPFFTALESSLAQGDVTNDRVEQVTLDYLDKLLGVASLKVMACYVEKESDADGEVDNLHVFARTRGEPKTWWYRRREDGTTWTSWEEIKAGISGKHLIPVVHNRRLMLFWAEFVETQSEHENANPASWYEIGIAWSEYRDGAWSAKRQSSTALALRYGWMDSLGLNKTSLTRYGFVTGVDEDGDLTLRCVAARDTSAIAYWSRFYELGTFTLNPCTMDFSIDRIYVETEVSRIALDPTKWSSPGFSNAILDLNDPDFSPIRNLDVYAGTVDDEGFARVGATAIDVLNQITSAMAVVPSQWNDFVSQSPFFVNVGERVYFVEPEVESTLHKAVSVTSPPLAGIQSFTADTWALPVFKNSGPIEEVTDGPAAEREVVMVSLRVDDDRALFQSEPSFTPMTLGHLGTYRFTNFYHPWVCRFISEVRRNGVFGLTDPDPAGTAADLYRQGLKGDDDDFEDRFEPTSAVVLPYPVEDIDFSYEGAYSQYNWEVFFHLPLYLASRLADAGRYQESIDWFHTMFDPRTRTSAAASGFSGVLENADWWKVKPFLDPVSGPVTDWIDFTGANGDADAQVSFQAQVDAWRDDPFDPHMLAAMRPGTYQRALVMRYLDTLIAWGDHLFTQDTIETINEATQLYVFAKQVLGDRPELLEDAQRPAPQTYNQLESALDTFSNPLIALENSAFSASTSSSSGSGAATVESLGLTTYFCVPFNARLLSFWDTTDDRLFKIRNGMNIGGVVRSLPLFQPPIDPAMLVRAAAAGIDIGSALSAGADVGNYRFSTMIGRAQSLTNTVRGLGQALLSALEKRDAEALALLRQGHEQAVLDAVKDVREQQIEEAKTSLEGLRKSRTVTQERHKHYDRLIDTGWIKNETVAGDLLVAGGVLDLGASAVQGVAGVVAWIPEVTIGLAPGAQAGGIHASTALSASASALSTISGTLKSESSRLTIVAGYKRRKTEWTHQRELAKLELASLDEQIKTAVIRQDIAKNELRNHELQIAHSAEVRDWMERKYTNKDLYDWMSGQLSTLHFQAWQLAQSTARKAQACYNHELGRTDDYIGAAHWDGTRKGLLAADRLQLDLERMDQAYLDNDVREFELTKHISLARLDPLALAHLRATGECWFQVPESLFDLDCPSHYFRRISSVALTAACVAGSQGQVNLELTLHGSRTRTDTSGGVTESANTDKPSIVTSTANQDAGLFNADPAQPRYLPFERRGVASDWRLAFTNRALKQIDWDTITDVVLHVRYTARDAGASFASTADLLAEISALQTGFIQVPNPMTPSGVASYLVGVSAKRDDPDGWWTARDAGSDTVNIALGEARLPYFALGRSINVAKIHVMVVGAPATAGQVSAGGQTGPLTFGPWTMETSDLVHGATDPLFDGDGDGAPDGFTGVTTWPDEVTVTLTGIDLSTTEDIVVAVEIDVS